MKCSTDTQYCDKGPWGGFPWLLGQSLLSAVPWSEDALVRGCFGDVCGGSAASLSVVLFLPCGAGAVRNSVQTSIPSATAKTIHALI